MSKGHSLMWIFMALLMLCTSCKERRPNGVLRPGKLQNLLYDYHVARTIAMQSGDSVDFRRFQYTTTVLSRHGVTQQQFDSTMLWYARHTDQLYSIYQNVERRIQKEARLLGTNRTATNVYADLSSEGDTANIWNGPQFVLLSVKDANNRLTFHLNADSTFLPGDRFLWNFHTFFIYPSGQKDGVAVLTVRYDNDSVSTRLARLPVNDDFSMELTAAVRPLKSVSGFVYLHSGWTKEERLLMLNHFSLVRFHRQEPLNRPRPAAEVPSELERPLLHDSDSIALPPQMHHAPVPMMKKSPRKLLPADRKE